MRFDTQDLRAIIALVEESSVTSAGDRLGISQSAMSHRIAAWHSDLGRPLFVKSGRSLTPTPEAQRIAQEGKQILDRIDQLFEVEIRDFTTLRERFTIASTDFERGLFLHDVQKEVLTAAPSSALSFVWDNLDSREALRKGHHDVAVGRLATALGEDFHWEELCSVGLKVFYDPAVRNAPLTPEDYWNSRHLRVIFSRDDDTYVDNFLATTGHEQRRIIATEVPSLWEVMAALRGTDLLVTTPCVLMMRSRDELAYCDPPIPIPPVSIGMMWHDRTAYSASHAWLRSVIRSTIKNTVNTSPTRWDGLELKLAD